MSGPAYVDDRIACFICGAVTNPLKIKHAREGGGASLWEFRTPEEWIELSSNKFSPPRIICPNHDVVIQVDGKITYCWLGSPE